MAALDLCSDCGALGTFQKFPRGAAHELMAGPIRGIDCHSCRSNVDLIKLVRVQEVFGASGWERNLE